MSAMHMANSFDPDTDPVDEGVADLLARRRRSMGAAYRLFYSRPVSVVRASGVHLFDDSGADYLDAYNNVPVAGHSNPRVAAAVSTALLTLSTHTRYLTSEVVEYAERLVALFPDELSQVVFGCSGSDAVDLSLRVARHVTGRRGVVVTAHAYHGTTQAAAEVSPSLGPNNPIPPWVVRVPVPDPRDGGASAAAQRFADDVAAAADELERRGFGAAALVVDSIMISDGLVLADQPLLRGAVDAVRARGGLYVADEVQSGFGRTGRWWGFPAHDVVPDLVVLGKPMGGGMPISGVVGRPELFDAFGRDVRHFNTFAGSGASVAAAAAVLDEIQDRHLLERASTVGERLVSGLRDLGRDHAGVSDVRGRGLVVAVELAGTGGEGARRARAVVDGLRERRILVSASGPAEDVVKIRPPLVFDHSDVDRFLEGFEEVLGLS